MREKGVSPVVGTILLIAITIALVGVVLAMVSGLGSRGTPLLARIRIVDVGQDGIILAHEGGDELIAEKTLVKVEINGNVTEEVLSNLGTGGTFEVGDQVTISGVNYSRGDKVKVTIIDQNSKTKIFEGSAYVTDAIAKKRPITIYGSSSDLTGYQVEVVVDYDSDMQPDFDDLRFKDDDEVTELPYWIENYNPSENAIVWVKVPSIPASDNKTIYMYYGNPSVGSESSKENTMGIVDVGVGADVDDGEEDGRVAGTHSWKTDGYYGDNALFLGYASPYNRPFEIVWRFDNITASGKALDGCKIEIWHNDDHTESGTSDNAYLYGIDEADAVTFSETDNSTWPSNRNRTTEYVPWNPVAETSNGTHEHAESPEIKTIIQELLDSYTYTGTQAMAFYWRVESTSTWWRNYDDYGAPSTPKLHIEYRKYTSPEPSASIGSETLA